MEKKKVKRFALNGFDEPQAKKIIGNYFNKASRNRHGKINETISVWFSIKEFTDFAQVLLKEEKEGRRLQQQQGASKKVKITDGVRVYFANYGEKGIAHKDEYIYQNTVVFVSTYADPNDPEKHKDYFVPYDRLPHKADTVEVESKKSDPMNRGGLCPPDTCDGDEPSILKRNEIDQ